MKSAQGTKNEGARKQYLMLGQAIICLIITTIGLNVCRAVLQTFEAGSQITTGQFDLIYLAISVLAVIINGVLLFRVDDRLVQVLYVVTAVIMIVSQPGFYV